MTPNAYDDLTAQALADMRVAGHEVMTRAAVCALFKVAPATVDSWMHRRDNGDPADPRARFPNPAGYTVGEDRGAWYLSCAIRAWGLYTGRLPMHRDDIATMLDVGPGTVDAWVAPVGQRDRDPAHRFPPAEDYDARGDWWRWAKVRAWAVRTGRAATIEVPA